MRNKLKKEDLEEFVVRIEYKKDKNRIERASGVIVKIDDSLVYILTVKHFLKSNPSQLIEQIDDENINIQNLSIKNYNNKKIEIEKSIFVKDKKFDILILKADDSSLKLFSKIKSLNIFMDEFCECAIFGYPRSREKTNNSLVLHASHPDKIDLDDNYFEVKADIPLHSFGESEVDNIKGLSGSGVFVKGKSGKIYLVGIQFRYMDMIYLESLNLRIIKKDIDEVIEQKLPVGEYPFFEELGIDIDKIVFDSLDEYFLLNRDIQKFQKKLKKNSNKELQKLESDYISLKENMKKIADRYFYLGKEFFQKRDLSKAYAYFSRAIELCPAYKHFFAKKEFAHYPLNQKQQKARKDLSDEIYFMQNNDLVEKILESEEKFLIKSEDKRELEKIYTKLVYLSTKSKDRLIELFLKLSKIKFLNNKVEEAENILLNLKNSADDRTKEHINQELLKMYLKSLDNGSMPKAELLKRIILLEKELKDKKNISITHIIKELKIENYYLDDCLIDYINTQKKKIIDLKYQNTQLKIENENCYKHKSHNPVFLVQTTSEINKKWIFFGLMIALGVIIMSLEFMNYPIRDLISHLNFDFLIKMINH